MQNNADPEADEGNTIAFRATYNEYIRVIDQALRGHQAAHQTAIRLLLTLASGSLVASISLLRSSIHADTVWLPLLSVAWVLLGISVFACLRHLGDYNPYELDPIPWTV